MRGFGPSLSTENHGMICTISHGFPSLIITTSPKFPHTKTDSHQNFLRTLETTIAAVIFHAVIPSPKLSNPYDL